MKTYDGPIEVRELEKMITKFSYENGLDLSNVFDNFLSYVMCFFSEKETVHNLELSKKEISFFYSLLCEWLKVMDKELENDNSWFDAFGDLYQGYFSSNSKKSNFGQFFTPPVICDLMVQITCGNEKIKNKTISDTTAGSGRNLLAFHVNNLGNYLCAEDIDKICCWMCCCNFLIHGCIGEVVWHDSLDKKSFYGGWKINENLLKTGIPSLRVMKSEESIIMMNNTVSVEPLEQPIKIQQLSLF